MCNLFVIENKHISKLVKRYFSGKFGLRNAVAIYGMSVLGLTASELSLITIGDLVAKNGSVIKKWLLPKERAFNGVERIIYMTNEKHLEIIDDYLNWLIELDLFKTNSGEYRNLNPEAQLLVNDQYKPFGFTGRSSDPNKKLILQPSGMNSFMKRLISRSELKDKVTYSSFRKSIIIRLKRAGVKNKEIMEYTGIRDYESIRKITASDTITLEKAIQGIYSRI